MDTNDLFRAAQTNDVSLFERCIAEGLDPVIEGSRGENILHYISMKNSYGLLCHISLQHCHVISALINKADNDRDTPLHYCCFRKPPSLRICDKLISLGADPHRKDQWDQSCLELATVRGRTVLVTYLKWRQEHPQGLPRDIEGLDNTSIIQYINTFGSMHSGHALRYETAMKGRKEKSSNIRIIILGYQGVGKTTLYYRLTRQKRQVVSTDTLDILLNRLIIDRVTMERRLLEEDMEMETSLQRIKDVVIASMTTDDVTDVVDGVRPEGTRRPSSAYTERPRLAPPTTTRSISSSNSYSDLQAEAAVMMSKRPTECFGSCGQKTYVSVFDFGGESMFSNLQHIFLNSNAVILLVFSLHNCFEQKAILERVYFWLKFLATYSSEVTDFYRPPILLVGTHLDQIQIEDEQENVVEKVNKILSNNPDIAEVYRKHVVKFLTVDNTSDPDSCTMYDTIWHWIVEAAQYQSHWGQLLPGSWIALERELMRIKSWKKVITLEEVIQIGQALTVPLEAGEVKAMLEYLHMLRCILYFQIDAANDEMILDPQWMVEAFRKIVTADKFFDKQHGENHPLLKAYRKTGNLTAEFIEYVWKSDTSFMKFKETLLYYLERLGLLVKPLPEKGESIVNVYIVPCMLQMTDPKLFSPLIDNPRTVKTSTLCYDFQGRFIPPAVFNKILASCIHRFQVLSREGGTLYLQQGMACFVLSPRWNMILHCRDTLMKVTMFTTMSDNHGYREESYLGEGYAIRLILDGIVEATLERNNQGHVQCKYYLSDKYEIFPGERLYDVKDVEGTPIQSARFNGIDTRISLDTTDAALSPLDKSDYDVWFMSPEQSPRREKIDGKIPKSMLSRCPTPREMSRIAKSIGTCYSIFFACLGLEDATIDHIRLQYCHFHFRSQVTKMLIVWRNKLKNKATLSEVVKAMEFNDLHVDGMMEEITSMKFLTQRADSMDYPEDIDLPYKIQRSRPLGRDTWTFAECIGNMYFNALIELGLKNQFIEQAEMDNRNRVLYVIQSLVENWVKVQESEATILKLYNALDECQGDCMEFVRNKCSAERTDGSSQNQVVLRRPGKSWLRLVTSSRKSYASVGIWVIISMSSYSEGLFTYQ